MTHRRILMTAGGGSDAGGGGTLPPDPTLTEPRAVTRTYAMNQNTRPDSIIPVGGSTVPGPTVTILEDCADLRLLFHGASQGFISDPMTIKVAVKKPGASTWTPVLQGGNDAIVVGLDDPSLTDAITGPFLEGQTLDYRVYFADGQTVNVGMSGMAQDGGDYRLATTLTPSGLYPEVAPFPVAFIGSARASVKTIGIYGDSISANAAWFREACAANGYTGINYGRNVMTFGGRWLDANCLAPVTHMLSQFGVNDLSGGIAVAPLWANAVACYAYMDGLKPGLPIWQTTPTPAVGGVNNCTTLADQDTSGPRPPARLLWQAFLRDGAPCNPTTKAALAVGTTGGTGTVIRAGQTGHPLKGIVDIAAAVEHGGTSSPSMKWRVDLGPIGGDGVHPTDLGGTVITPVVSDWMASLT